MQNPSPFDIFCYVTAYTMQSNTSMLKAAHVEIDPSRMEVKSHGRDVRLRRREYEILMLFIRHRDRTLTRNDIIDSTSSLAGAIPNITSIDVHISRLRKAIGTFRGRQLIETVHGVGYRLADFA